MIYGMENGEVSDLIDRYRTGNYGEDFCVRHMTCCSCDKEITEGERYFDVGGSVYCMDCADVADECILDAVRGEYIYEM